MQKYNRGKINNENSNNNYKKSWRKGGRKRHSRPHVKGLAVIPYEGENIESVLRRFKKVVDSAGIMKELKNREFYMSKSQKIREKKKKALKRLRKRERAMRRYHDN